MVDPIATVTQTKPEWKKPGEYEVKPLETWGKIKEVRRKHAKNIWTAKQEGKVTILGLVDMASPLPAGLGDVAVFTLGPNFGRIMDDNALAAQCCEAAEARGFGPDTCATLRAQLGSIYLGFHNLSRSGERIPLDFCLEMHVCIAQSKIAREMSDHYDIPYHMVEIPGWTDPASQEYFAGQMDDAIHWMEEVTGRTYNDELLIEATHIDWRNRVLWARILELTRHVPSPIDLRMIGSMNVMLQVGKTRSADLTPVLEELLAELKDRVANNIAALGVEKVRLIHEGQWPQFSCGSWAPGVILRVGVPYGAVFVAGRNAFNIYAAWEVLENGSWRAANNLEEQGITLKDRGDALRSIARLYSEYWPNAVEMQLAPRVKHLMALAKDWHADGVVFNLDRSCHGVTPGMLESRPILQEMGIPSMVYEASYCDPRDFDRPKVEEGFESFLEGMGLTRGAA
ncbi:MAG: 2-hydroxyacyl-CoA dehydratase family protein [Dehalococcoidia bacterium]|jgi:benzoyl-CoA reductase/2-hydroxyglutaryl-CoA dehydratase subunit BcrC/BadD/HgdB|nr:2-hydroxyacyl-CoA dehydratase family protein [Dehalococcoidia bacterium]